jgi:hypothetical protein
VFEAAIGHQAWRLRDNAEPTLEQLRKLQPEDLALPQDQAPVDWPGAAKAPEATAATPEEPVAEETVPGAVGPASAWPRTTESAPEETA